SGDEERIAQDFWINEVSSKGWANSFALPEYGKELSRDLKEISFRRQSRLDRRQDSLALSWGSGRKVFPLLPELPQAVEGDRWLHECILRFNYDASGVTVRTFDHRIKEDIILFNRQYRNYDRIDGIRSRLSYHTDVARAMSLNYSYSFNRVRDRLLDNPFLGEKIAAAEFLREDEGSGYYGYGGFNEKLRAAYPWHEILYGDSTLQLEKQVSFEDLATSYRDPVTSSKELTLASTAINANRNKGSLLDARTVAVGLSDFIAERAQEELNLTFFERFKANLKDSSELTILFPNTRDLLYQFQISNYKTLLSFAKTSFQTDLDNLGLNFPKILDLEKYRYLKNDPNVFNLSLIYSIADLAYKEYPIETIMLAANQKLRDRQRNLGRSINLRIAEGVLGELPPAEIVPDSAAIGEEWRRFQDSLAIYLEELRETDNAFYDITSRIDLLQRVSQRAEETSVESIQKRISGTIGKWERQRKQYIESDYGEMTYQGRTSIGTKLPFTTEIIEANLAGREYYDLIIGNPREGDYERYFGAGQTKSKIKVAAGLRRLRELLGGRREVQLEQGAESLLNSLQVAEEIE
ncbi:MAG: hypothetical protein AAFN92_15135, partial [Bacteroidota bacterium]